MKVYIISANWGHGGPGGITADLYQRLSDAGHKCRFAYARGTVPQNINSYRIGSMKDVYMHVAVARIFDNAGFLSTQPTRFLTDDIMQFAPDIISIQNPLGYSLNVEFLMNFIKEKKIPTFWTLHDCWSFTGHCTTELCEKLNKGCGKCPHKKDFPKSILFDQSARNVLRKEKLFSDISSLQFVAPCEWIAGLARQSFLKTYPITVIQNGIDLQVFKPSKSNILEEHGISNKKVLLAVASVWSSRKGSEYIYQLADKLEDEYQIVMIGKNDDKKAKSYSNILSINHTENREELAKWYSAADIFINPTTGDNFPTVNLEALACGTPVISFDTGGCAEAIGNCGTVVPQRDVDGMLEAVKRIFVEPISEEECVSKATAYDKNDRYEDYIKLFKSVLEREN